MAQSDSSRSVALGADLCFHNLELIAGQNLAFCVTCSPSSLLSQAPANQLVPLLVEKFKGAMGKLELLMPSSLHTPVNTRCPGTAQPGSAFDFTAG